MQILEERHYFQDIEGIRRALDHLLPTLRAAADPALKDIYVARVAERTGVRRETLERELTNDRPFRGVVTPRPATRVRGHGASAPVVARADGWASERLLLLLLLRDAQRIADAGRVIAPNELREPEHRELFESMLEHGPLPAEPPLTFGLGVSARQRLAELRVDAR
jgi:hypothetical protein